MAGSLEKKLKYEFHKRIGNILTSLATKRFSRTLNCGTILFRLAYPFYEHSWHLWEKSESVIHSDSLSACALSLCSLNLFHFVYEKY